MWTFLLKLDKYTIFLSTGISSFIKPTVQNSCLSTDRICLRWPLAHCAISFAACSQMFFILASSVKLFILLFKVPSYWCYKSINYQRSLSFLTIHLAVLWIMKIIRPKRATFFPVGCHGCHTEQRVAICWTLPMSIRSCLMWRFSWGSLVRGSGGSSSPVKSSQLSRTKREKRTNKFKWKQNGMIRRSEGESSLPFLLKADIHEPFPRGLAPFLSHPTRTLALLVTLICCFFRPLFSFMCVN